VALLSEVRESICLALLREGHFDLNTEDPKLVNGAVTDLKKLYNICNVKVGDVQYQTIPEDKAWLNQAWSGDMLSATFYYLPNKQTGKLLRFWSPEMGKGPIGNDMWSICKGTKKPVLAHLFLNFMLDNGNAYDNFINFNGYQPPLNEIDPHELVKKGLIPETLSNCVMTSAELGPTALQEMTLTTQGQQLWENGYSNFLAG
jgi:spermidine/putrescine transport system substrate-binding protein